MKKISKAIIYTRVSTDDQAENGTSLAAQKIACKKKAAQIGAQVTHVFEDAGVSGSLFVARPGLQTALKSIEEKEANVLIVYNISRLSRDREHQSTIKKMIERAGAQLIFVDMTFEDTPEGDLAFGIMGTFADYERKAIRKRTMTGRRRRAEEGTQPSRSKSPYGYHIVTKSDVLSGEYSAEALGTYQIVEKEAKWIRHIFTRYANELSLTKLSRELQSLGVPTPEKAVYWHNTTIQRILTNPVYKGKPAFGRFMAKMDEGRAARGLKVSYIVKAEEENRVYLEAPPLVDEETFTLCQQKLVAGRWKQGGNPAQVRMLSTLIRCPICGKAMPGKRVKRVYRRTATVTYDHFYRCQQSCPSSNSAGKVCNGKNYRADILEELTLKSIREMAEHPEVLATAIAAYSQKMSVENVDEEITQHKRRLQEIEVKEKATVQAQIATVSAGGSPEPFISVLVELKQQREDIKERLASLKFSTKTQQEPKKESQIISEIFADLCEVLHSEQIEPVERRNLLAQVIAEITPRYDEDGKLGVLVCLKSTLPNSRQKTCYQTVAMISTLARGTVTGRPSSNCAVSTRTSVSDSTSTSSLGSAVTVPSRPK